ncbi:ATP-binding protein [Flavobacterium sp. RHBU_24]|uniref:GAF domain-containing sensor histidine kinase n=1 Tax=Flavobacterium sp. RHBU_24 TaxID=3391185 RepID=UPI003984FE08
MIYQKPASIIPKNDEERLEKLREYQILDTHSEDTFDKIALMASQIFGTPSAFISFVDKDRVFFKSNLSSLPVNEVDRNDSLCSLAILQEDITLFQDTHDHNALMESKYVAAEGGIRFYAGAPLKSPEGFNMGTICVVDSVPRERPTDQQLEMLRTLSTIVIDKLENRLRYRKSVESQINLMNIALHEIKNPLASIKLANEIMTKNTGMAEKMTANIKSAVANIQKRLGDYLAHSELEEKDLALNIEPVDLRDMFNRLVNNFELLAHRKRQIIELYVQDTLPPLEGDRNKISDVLHNLLSNAIKYSYESTTIKVSAREAGNYVHIEVKDQGQGLTFGDMQKLFTKFAKLSSKPTGKETSNGLGLSITKSFVELHKGNIYAMSPGKEKGTTFIVSIPFKHRRDTEGSEAATA